MKRIIFISFLNLWSMEKNKGAPSFYNTVKGYVDSGWDVILINPLIDKNSVQIMDGVKNITFTLPNQKLCQYKKIGYFFKLYTSLYLSCIFYKYGKELLDKGSNKTILYAYEVHAVKAAKKLSQEFNTPLITRFQGTILAETPNTLFNRIRFYPHFTALKTASDLAIMTDDGTFGDRVLNRVENKSKKNLFWKNGVDIPLNRLDEQRIQLLKTKLHIFEDEIVLLTVSRLVSWKKVDRAIQALHEVVQKNIPCKLVIVGDGDSKNALVSLTKNLGLQNYVIFLGAVSHNEVFEYMNMSDIFLSLYDLSNLGNPLFEAMSCGKAIITLDVGNTASIIKNDINGILLKSNELDKIPSYIEKLSKNKDYAKYLGSNAQNYARENFWTWEQRIAAEISEAECLI